MMTRITRGDALPPSNPHDVGRGGFQVNLRVPGEVHARALGPQNPRRFLAHPGVFDSKISGRLRLVAQSTPSGPPWRGHPLSLWIRAPPTGWEGVDTARRHAARASFLDAGSGLFACRDVLAAPSTAATPSMAL